MSYDTLMQQIAKIQAEQPQLKPISPLEARLRDVEHVFELGEIVLERVRPTESLWHFVVHGMESAVIDSLAIFGDFKEAYNQAFRYGQLMQQYQTMN